MSNDSAHHVQLRMSLPRDSFKCLASIVHDIASVELRVSAITVRYTREKPFVFRVMLSSDLLEPE